MKDPVDDVEIKSLREGLASWGAVGVANWSDPKGEMLPVPKVTFARLLDTIEMWKRRAAQHGCNVEESDHECG